jgi:hypothetical protein
MVKDVIRTSGEATGARGVGSPGASAVSWKVDVDTSNSNPRGLVCEFEVSIQSIFVPLVLANFEECRALVLILGVMQSLTYLECLIIAMKTGFRPSLW